MHLIADDLDRHAWYVDLVDDLVADAEAFAARWAAFEDVVARLGEPEDAGESVLG